MTNQTKLYVTKHFHPHSRRRRKQKKDRRRRKGWWQRPERERKKSKKAHKSSMHLFNFHTRRDFYKLLWQSWEAGWVNGAGARPQAPTSSCRTRPCSGYNVITGGAVHSWAVKIQKQHCVKACVIFNTSVKGCLATTRQHVLRITNEEVERGYTWKCNPSLIAPHDLLLDMFLQ